MTHEQKAEQYLSMCDGDKTLLLEMIDELIIFATPTEFWIKVKLIIIQA